MNRLLVPGLLSLACTAAALGQTVVAGPTVNPANGHRYTLIQGSSWEQARTWARARGSELATIEDAAENAWAFSTFGTNGRKYLLGMADRDRPGTLEWSDGSTSPYRNWAPGEPASGPEGQRYVIVQTDQKWYTRGTNYAPYYLVETSGALRVPEEYPTVQSALGAMASTNTYEVRVGPGNFVIPSMAAAMPPAGRTGRLVGAGADATTIVVNSAYDGLTLPGNWVIEDLLLLRGQAGAAVGLVDGCARMTRVVVDGGGVNTTSEMVRLDARSLLLARSCTFQNGRTLLGNEFYGGAATFDGCILRGIGSPATGDGTATFTNCTMSGIGGPNVTAFATTTRLVNCIVWNRTGTLSTAGFEAVHCNIQGGPVGGGNIDADPRFMSADDLSLQPGSPCLDAGSAAEMLGGGLDFAGRPRIAGAGPDMGAFEAQAPSCHVDFNEDGFVDFFDYDDFVRAFEEGC